MLMRYTPVGALSTASPVAALGEVKPACSLRCCARKSSVPHGHANGAPIQSSAISQAWGVVTEKQKQMQLLRVAINM